MLVKLYDCVGCVCVSASSSFVAVHLQQVKDSYITKVGFQFECCQA